MGHMVSRLLTGLDAGASMGPFCWRCDRKQVQASRHVSCSIPLSADYTQEVASVALGVQWSLSFHSLGQISEALGEVLVSQSED